MPPAYYKYTDKNVIEYFSRIINSVSDCKIILYNFEKLAGYKFSLNCVEELKNRFPDQIVGIKDSTYNIYDKYKKNELSILVGSEEKLLSGLKAGCHGVISATCNVTSKIARKLYDDFHSNETQKLNEKLHVRTFCWQPSVDAPMAWKWRSVTWSQPIAQRRRCR